MNYTITKFENSPVSEDKVVDIEIIADNKVYSGLLIYQMELNRGEYGENS
jgi:hypothetical protein